jgi:hypothetical protein
MWIAPPDVHSYGRRCQRPRYLGDKAAMSYKLVENVPGAKPLCVIARTIDDSGKVWPVPKRPSIGGHGAEADARHDLRGSRSIC